MPTPRLSTICVPEKRPININIVCVRKKEIDEENLVLIEIILDSKTLIRRTEQKDEEKKTKKWFYVNKMCNQA